MLKDQFYALHQTSVEETQYQSKNTPGRVILHLRGVTYLFTQILCKFTLIWRLLTTSEFRVYNLLTTDSR